MNQQRKEERLPQPLYCEVKRLAALLEASHPCPPGLDLERWLNDELQTLQPICISPKFATQLIRMDYLDKVLEHALTRSLFT